MTFEYLATAIVLVIAVFISVRKRSDSRQLAHIPSLGPTGLLSYVTCFRFASEKGVQMLQDAYELHRDWMFKLPLMNGWAVVVCSQQLIQDIWNASDGLSLSEALEDALQMRYTLGPSNVADQFHIKIMLTSMTRNLSVRYSDVYDEASTAVEELVGRPDCWTAVPVWNVVAKTISRTSSRFFLGLPLCRDESYMQLKLDFAKGVVDASAKISLLPSTFWGLGGKLFSPLPKAYAQAKHQLTPFIAQRIKEDEELGKGRHDRPNDMITWLLDGLEESYQPDAEYLTLRFLLIDFAALHTTSNNLTQAILNLAEFPEHAEKMREEIKYITSTVGWTKNGIDDMAHVDSFLRESLRLNGSLALTLTRKVVDRAGYRFSDGTLVPYGTYIATPGRSVQRDSVITSYTDATVFKGFRFVGSADNSDHPSQLAVPATDFLVWGAGRLACPGRVFAASMLKTVFAFIVLHFDVKLKDGVRPRDIWYADRCRPDPMGEVMFKCADE